MRSAPLRKRSPASRTRSTSISPRPLASTPEVSKSTSAGTLPSRRKAASISAGSSIQLCTMLNCRWRFTSSRSATRAARSSGSVSSRAAVRNVAMRAKAAEIHALTAVSGLATDAASVS